MGRKAPKKIEQLPVQIHYSLSDWCDWDPVHQDRDSEAVKFASMPNAFHQCAPFLCHGGYIVVVWPEGKGFTTECFSLDLEKMSEQEKKKCFNTDWTILKWEDGKRVNPLSVVHEIYEKAMQFYRRKIEEVTAQQRQHHLTTDWRSLRGTPFEDFVADVFKSA